MTYDPHAKIRYDGVWRPEPWFAGIHSQWQPVRYWQVNRQRTEREVYREMCDNVRVTHVYVDEAIAQAVCDALNKRDGKA